MSSVTFGGAAVAASMSVAAAFGQLLLADLVERRAPRFYAWITGYRGLVARWSLLATVMLGVAVFLVVVAPGIADRGNRASLFAFAGCAVLTALAFAAQIPRELRRASLDGRRRR